MQVKTTFRLIVILKNDLAKMSRYEKKLCLLKSCKQTHEIIKESNLYLNDKYYILNFQYKYFISNM